MKILRPDLTLEHILLSLEHELLDATDEELLDAARELGMKPEMKGSAAFLGVKYAYGSRLLALYNTDHRPGAPTEAGSADVLQKPPGGDVPTS